MKFWEAMKAMEEGKKVTHEGLKSYYFVQDNKPHKIWYRIGESASEAYIDLYSALKYEWKVYEENK